MTLAVSTSGSLVSLAVFEGRDILHSSSAEALRNASGVLQRLIQEAPVRLGDVDLFVADVGPGSFIGTRVGVMMLKTLAFTFGKPACGVSSFDLIDPGGPALVPNKRNEWFLRKPGQEPVLVSELPEGLEVGVPEAWRASLCSCVPQDPIALLPAYLVGPSISLPKTPYREVAP